MSSARIVVYKSCSAFGRLIPPLGIGDGLIFLDSVVVVLIKP